MRSFVRTPAQHIRMPSGGESLGESGFCLAASTRRDAHDAPGAGLARPCSSAQSSHRKMSLA